MKKTFLLAVTILLMLMNNHISAQDCAIANTTINVIDDSSFPNFDISVKGNVLPIPINCNNVKVELCCESDNNPCVEQIVSVDQNNGSWIAVFEDFSCICHDSISFFIATVVCDDTDCGEGKAELRYQCPSDNECPTINTVSVSIGDCTIDDVTSCGYHTLTFTPFITGTPNFYNWDWGEGTSTPGVGVPGTETQDYYKPPVNSPKLTLFTTDCQPVNYVITGTNFQICDGCPSESQIQINTSINNCVLTGSVIADFCEEQHNSVLIDYGDNTNDPLQVNQLNGFTINHTYNANDNYNFQIILLNDGGSCTYTKEIIISNCGGGNGDNGNGDDGCFFCFCFNLLCCILYVLFILAIIGTIVSLAFALCNGNTAAWVSFGIFLTATIALLIWLYFVCDVPICELIIALGIGGTLNWAIICGTNILPTQCKSWFCQMTTIPILGFQMQNILIVNIVLWLLALILCTI